MRSRSRELFGETFKDEMPSIWPGTQHQPCCVYWKHAVLLSQEFVDFDLAQIADKLLPVKEEVDHRNGGIRLRISSGGNMVQATEGTFGLVDNARMAITVLQFCQAAGMKKKELEHVKTQLCTKWGGSHWAKEE